MNATRDGASRQGVNQDYLEPDYAKMGAVEVAPGRYVVQGNGGLWYIVGSWRKMPTWWSPELRFAWQHAGNTAIHPCEHGGFGITAERPTSGCHGRRITADFETGQEVPA